MSVPAILLRCAAAFAMLLLCAPPASATPTPLRFEFHSSLLMNLHHFLFQRARQGGELDSSAWPAQPDATELRTLTRAIEFYRAEYARRDPLFDADMTAVKQSLRAADDAGLDTSGLGLPAGLAEQLQRVAPIYARCLWPQHDASNKAWIARAEVLNARHGAAVQAALEIQLAHDFTRLPLRTDLVFTTGTFQGAYSGEQPEQIVMPSGRPDYQGDASLEMLYHEASHVGVMEPIEARLEALLRQRKPAGGADQLWHVLQFHTVGRAVQREFKRSGVDYQPYAVKGGLYRRAGWDRFLPAIEQHWQPWLDGSTGLAEALEGLVRTLPPAP